MDHGHINNSENQKENFLSLQANETGLETFGRSFVYTLLQSPVDALAQMYDGKADGPSQEAVHRIDAPKPAEFGSSSWVAQQVGCGLGAILPVLAIHSGVSASLGRNYSMRAGLALSENMAVLTEKQMLASSGMKLAESGLTGFIYSGAFTPVRSDEQDFFTAKAKAGLSGALTFATLSGSGIGMKYLGERTATSLPLVSKTFSSGISNGFLSGLPAGLVAANSESLLSGKGMATLEHQTQAALTFGLTGAGFAYGNAKIAEIGHGSRKSHAPDSFKNAGVDVDGRLLAESKRDLIAQNFPEYSKAEKLSERSQTLRELAQIKALKEGRSVLDEFRDSGLSLAQKYRVLQSLGEVREHFVKQRPNGQLDPDQQGNWIHTQGEFGRVIEVSRMAKLNSAQTEDALLASMFADSVKNKANFFTHHIDGAIAADHILSREFDLSFNRKRLDGIVHSVREHQIGPPVFMSGYYASKIRGALNFTLTPEQESTLASLQKKMSEPLNPLTEIERAADGGSILKLSNAERQLLQLTGVNNWYVPNESHAWNKSARAVIDGDSIDNYFTPGGVAKITALGGPESDKWFMTDLIDGAKSEVERTTNIGCARSSGKDAKSLLTPEGHELASNSGAHAEAAISHAKAKNLAWLLREKGLDASTEEIPFINRKLKYPVFNELDTQWWDIHRMPADKRTLEQQQFYENNRFNGLNAKEQSEFLLAKEIRERIVEDLRRAQRINNTKVPGYFPVTR